jgi:hypothetical protein
VAVNLPVRSGGGPGKATTRGYPTSARFPKILSLPESDQNRLKNQLKVMRAEHAQYADQTYRNIAFFEKFL